MPSAASIWGCLAVSGSGGATGPLRGELLLLPAVPRVWPSGPCGPLRAGLCRCFCYLRLARCSEPPGAAGEGATERGLSAGERLRRATSLAVTFLVRWLTLGSALSALCAAAGLCTTCARRSRRTTTRSSCTSATRKRATPTSSRRRASLQPLRVTFLVFSKVGASASHCCLPLLGAAAARRSRSSPHLTDIASFHLSLCLVDPGCACTAEQAGGVHAD